MPQSCATSVSCPGRVRGRRVTCDILWCVITHGHVWDQDAFNWEEVNLEENDRYELKPRCHEDASHSQEAEQKLSGKTPTPPVNSVPSGSA